MGNVHMEAKQINDRTETGKRQSVADHLKALDALAQKIDNLPTFTSNDRAFLEELPAFPSEDGAKVLTATTTSGETSLSYEAIPNELPADPATDGTRVLTATTTSGDTVKSWEDPASGGVDYSTTEQNTGLKWIDGKDIYKKSFSTSESFTVGVDWTATGLEIPNADLIIAGEFVRYESHGMVSSCDYNLSSGVVRVNRAAQLTCTNGYAITAYYTKSTV